MMTSLLGQIGVGTPLCYSLPYAAVRFEYYIILIGAFSNYHHAISSLNFILSYLKA